MSRTASAVWPISRALVAALDERLGTPVDSYLNGSQTWLVDELEFRLHPVAAYRLPDGCSHYDLWESVVAQLAIDVDDGHLILGSETRALTTLWDGLECFAAYGDDIEPAQLAARAAHVLGVAPQKTGLVDHDAIGDAWERANGSVSIFAMLSDQLSQEVR